MNASSVFVLDDDVAVCRILNRMLSEEKYEVQTSQSVKDAVVAIEEKPFDAYVLDYRLPDGSGLDVAQLLRSKGSEAPIIFISGYDSSSIAEKAESLGVFDIIEKPFARDTICDAVRKSIGRTNGDSPNGADSEKPTSVEAITPKRRPTSAIIIGAVIFLLIVVGLAIYLLTRGP
jgi:DNA-binding NtrC family response regulator